MSKKLYVGNLPFDATTDTIRAAFERYGTVHNVSIVTDRVTGRSRGFCFVEMDDASAQAAIEGLDSKDFGGRNLKVNEARDRQDGRRRK